MTLYLILAISLSVVSLAVMQKYANSTQDKKLNPVRIKTGRSEKIHRP